MSFSNNKRTKINYNLTSLIKVQIKKLEGYFSDLTRTW